jgi:hypothetical protein
MDPAATNPATTFAALVASNFTGNSTGLWTDKQAVGAIIGGSLGLVGAVLVLLSLRISRSIVAAAASATSAHDNAQTTDYQAAQ